MAEKRFRGAPFGCQSTRFDVSSLHPVYKKPGTYTQVAYCRRATSEQGRRLGPGSYEPSPGDFSAAVLERKASTPGWKRAEETERLTGMPHLLYRETWERNRLLKENMGPGRYNFKSFTDDLEEKPRSVRGACSTREVRFKENIEDCNPGPGSYGKGGNPYTVVEERASKSASYKGIMDSGSSKDHCAAGMGCDLGPGTYNLKYSTDETLNHVVGKRGPYDLFTGSRGKPILYGYFATPKNSPSEPGQYKVKSFTEELENEQRKTHGKFGKIAQYPKVPTERILCNSLTHWPRPADSPGPGAYDAKPLFSPVRQSSAPFQTSAKRFDKKSCRLLFGSSALMHGILPVCHVTYRNLEFFPAQEPADCDGLVRKNSVGVGRYDINKPPRGKTATSFRTSFISKTGRYLSDPERDKVLQERIQKSHTPLPAGNRTSSAPPSTA